MGRALRRTYIRVTGAGEDLRHLVISPSVHIMGWSRDEDVLEAEVEGEFRHRVEGNLRIAVEMCVGVEMDAEAWETKEVTFIPSANPGATRVIATVVPRPRREVLLGER